MNTRPIGDLKLILLSAGGTGGHIMPAQALARDLLSRGYLVEMVTDRRGMAYTGLFEEMRAHLISAGTLRPGLKGKVAGLAAVGLGLFQAFRLIRRLKPAVVVGFGGYSSFPMVYAAQLLKIPTVIHEQNAIIGKANAFLASRASRIALSLPAVSGLDDADKARAVLTGNPVRPEIAALYTAPYPSVRDNGALRIFIMGGSQAARVFADVVPPTLTRLPADYKARLHIVQQCREEDQERVRALYAQSGIRADLLVFFDDVATQLREAHLVIARSGASTVAEVTAAGRPAIFVPYPHHKDQQQKMNAEAVADAGGAWMMTESGFTQDALLARIETFLQNPQTLFRAAEKSRSCGRPDAARKLGNLVTALASGWTD
ncbi:MAG: undecaprenyldiphospho-muramoylpentapeptide beta-N-acetylglucosaminyltransferase [Alphaproteobacteria bacterium]|nr:undecaprenyldiphospho-muramoylpentapeptide beta-N-acetylglucosaminyltransferase [Alphaproteobacteria bacterium]